MCVCLTALVWMNMYKLVDLGLIYKYVLKIVHCLTKLPTVSPDLRMLLDSA